MNPDFLEKLDLVRARALLDSELTGTPERIGRYEIERVLGAGATGIVYLASDPALGRRVVLKVLAPTLGADEAAVARFETEARIASGLDHPRITTVHDVGRDGAGLVYIAMAWREGRTLRERLAEGLLPVEEALRLAAEVAEGLGAAHAAGVVHRDVKPENILITARGACLLDFGIATLAGDGPRDTSGTPAYMSPEQAEGRPVDARSDLWALAAVLYEMLTGRRPITSETPPAPPSSLRPEVAPDLDALVLALLARDPASRPASAAEVRRRIEALTTARPATRSYARSGLMLAVLATLVALGVWAARARTSTVSGVDANLVAVAPFDALGDSLEPWREGLADLLSRDFDGAGPLRSVSPSMALPRWVGRSDQASAERYGRELGAGLVIFGTVVRVGADSVLLRASVLDRGRGVVRRDLEVAGEQARMGRLADSLALALLGAMGQERQITSSGEVPMGARSLPALKAFLQAEQLYRRREWDSAAAYYNTAATLDTTFGLALARLATVLDWGVPSGERYAPSIAYLRRAVALGYGPSLRERLQRTADSLGLIMLGRQDPDRLIAADTATRHRYYDLVRRYPEDPVLWTALGEIEYHPFGSGGRDFASARHSFGQAIALDSGFTPAYEHAMGLALWAGDTALARQLARAYLAHARSSSAPASAALTLLLMDREGDRRATDSAIAASSGNTLAWVGIDALQWWPDSAESVVRIMEALAEGRHDRAKPITGFDPAAFPVWHAFALASRGHLARAAEVEGIGLHQAMRGIAAMRDPFLDLALLGLLPDTLVARTFARGFGSDTAWSMGGGWPPQRHLLGLPWWYARGDTVSIARFGRRAADVAQHSDSGRAVLRGRYLAPAATAWLTLARGDTAAAIAAFRGLNLLLCSVGDCHFEQVKLAELLAQRGEDSAAAALLDRWGDVRGPTPSAVRARLLRGQLAERMGDRETALRCYRFVADLWRNADPLLRPDAERARANFARLTAKGS